MRSRCVPTRPERRAHGAGCLAPACERPLPAQRPPATVPALWSHGLAGPALSADTPGLGESRRMGSARAAGDLGPACLSAGAHGLERRPLRAGPPGPAGAPPGERAGGPPRGRSRCALAPGAWAPRARPPRGRALCPAPNLGRGEGHKRHRRAWPQRAWTGPGRIWRGRWRSMRARTAPAVCSRRSRSAAPSGAALTGGRTLPPTTTSGRCAGGSQQPWWPAAGPSAVSPPMARRALLPPAARSAGRGGLTAARCLAAPRWAKRGGAGGRARQGVAAPPPPRRTGRPRTPAAPQAARTPRRLAAPRAACCTARARCVPRPRHTSARQPLWRGSRGWPQVDARRAVRDHVSALGARRCRPQTARGQRATLRRRLLRCPQGGEPLKTRLAPTLAQALTCLEDTRRPATSQAVERGHRR